MSTSAGSEGVTRPEVVRVWQLGGFRVSVGLRTIEEEGRLRKATNLVRPLALLPNHRLHREQVLGSEAEG
jgi:hypothetical protein